MGVLGPAARVPVVPAPPRPLLLTPLQVGAAEDGEPLAFQTGNPEKTVFPPDAPCGLSLGGSAAAAWSLEGFGSPLPSLLCDGRGWHLFLLTSDNSEPYFPKVAEEQYGPGGLPEPQGVGGRALTGICCPLPRPTPQLPRSQALAPSPLVAASVHLLEENPSRGADARVPATGPLCTEQACPLHVLLWFGGPAPVCSLTLV